MGAFMQFLNDSILVIALVIAIVFSVLVLKIGFTNLKSYFSTRDGLGILKGIIAAPLVIVAIAAALFVLSFLIPTKAHAEIKIPGTFFNDASVFMGLDQTRKAVSPQCHEAGPDSRLTSNMGARLNLWQSDSKNVRINAQYTHHSCALNPDRQSYDGVGIQVEWFVWGR